MDDRMKENIALPFRLVVAALILEIGADESIDPNWLCVLNHNAHYAEGRGRRLLAYRSYSSPNQVPLQRPVINKKKPRGTSWAVIKESIVLPYSSDKKAGHACTPILRSSPNRLRPGKSP
ncbi:hypothetical protein PoB_005205200 [Plakobranchus ocellatus]|uniref:Uncharacterized protein n=1 Tax=Plakobranchus ocellatus TaxID=259542 RepID=A0AAV4C2R2_9GAST|nr:hypothetical protein PoB_005205200 [Plakobranchus ocellatus]